MTQQINSKIVKILDDGGAVQYFEPGVIHPQNDHLLVAESVGVRILLRGKDACDAFFRFLTSENHLLNKERRVSVPGIGEIYQCSFFSSN